MELIPKFRAWDKEGHRMILPKYLHSIDLLEEQVTERTKCNYTFSLHSIPFDRAKLMQSTGIFDKNDTEIFEGDVVEQKMLILTSEIEEITGVVKMLEGAWTIVNDKEEIACHLWREGAEMEVIGNVWEGGDQNN